MPSSWIEFTDVNILRTYFALSSGGVVNQRFHAESPATEIILYATKNQWAAMAFDTSGNFRMIEPYGSDNPVVELSVRMVFPQNP